MGCDGFVPVNMSNRTLIITGDDFGISSSVNEAIIRAHCEGILTSASLVINGRARGEAVALAKAHPQLGVGIHITLARGKATLPRKALPDLVDSSGDLPENPTLAGFRYFFDKRVRPQLKIEIESQVRQFMATGLAPSYIDGHLHMHVHPTILGILVDLAKRYAIPAFRLPRENLWVNLKLDRRNFWSKSLYALIYSCLCANAQKALKAHGIAFPDRFFGLLAMGHINESYLLGVMDHFGKGVTEISMHPALTVPSEVGKWAPHYEYVQEFQALISAKVRESIQRKGIQLASYDYFRQQPSKTEV